MPEINFHQGDCMDFMRSLPDKAFELAIVDPPYGIGRHGKPKSTSSHGGHKGYEFKGWDNEIPSAEYFTELFRVSKNQIIWGANYFAKYLPASSGWILWDKGQRIDQADGELAFSSIAKPLRVFTLNRVSILIDGAIHPTQKPVALYRWLLENYAKPGQRILDTHGGSMSSAIACFDLGFDLDICELDPDYFRDGKARFEKHVNRYHSGMGVPIADPTDYTNFSTGLFAHNQ
jgi:site-specific DNA-methyltransferase (adenine-specific)